MVRHNGESNAGRKAVHLALYVFFGPEMMRKKTAGTLDATKMCQLKEIILSKSPSKDVDRTGLHYGENARLP